MTRTTSFLLILLIFSSAMVSVPAASTTPLYYGPQLVHLQAADPRVPAPVDDAAAGLYTASLGDGAQLHLVWRDAFSLGIVTQGQHIQWVHVDGDRIVALPTQAIQFDIIDEEIHHEQNMALPGGRDGRLQLMLDGDQAFVDKFGPGAAAHQLAIIHLVAGIFAAQLQVVIEVIEQHLWGAPIDGTQPTTCGGVFFPWRAHWENAAPTTSHAREAMHLFTGQPIANAQGCAYTGQLETSAAYGLHKSAPIGSDPLLAMREVLLTAHELGHNFGGRHDRSAPTPGGPVMISGPCTLTTVATIMHPCPSLAILPTFSEDFGQSIFAERQIMKDGGNAPHMRAYAAQRI